MPKPVRPLLALAFVAALGFAPPLLADGEPSGSPPPDSPQAAAEKAIQARDWKNAMFHLRKAEREDAKNAAVHNWIGYVARQQGDLDQAFKSYAVALRLDPRHLGAHEYIGEAYLMAGKPDKAREHLTELERLCGRNCEQYRDLAGALEKHGKR